LKIPSIDAANLMIHRGSGGLAILLPDWKKPGLLPADGLYYYLQ
jgi:hypothetical protein